MLSILSLGFLQAIFRLFFGDGQFLRGHFAQFRKGPILGSDASRRRGALAWRRSDGVHSVSTNPFSAMQAKKKVLWLVILGDRPCSRSATPSQMALARSNSMDGAPMALKL